MRSPFHNNQLPIFSSWSSFYKRELPPIHFLLSGLGLSLLAVHATQPAFAQQVRADPTLSTTVNATGDDFKISGGNQMGSNLFHSFEEFSVPTGGSAAFLNSADVQNIISRVTGDRSNIDGRIEANGRANLFLLNPNGIVFGPDAKLQIGGSFIGSTAQSLSFTDSTVFSTTETSTPALLTVSTPSGLQFGQLSRDIAVQGTGYSIARQRDFSLAVTSGSNLQVNSGNTIALLGNGLSLESSRVSTNAGRAALGSVSAGEVDLTPEAQGWHLDYSKVSDYSDLSFSQSIADAVGAGGGLVTVHGQNVSVENGSRVLVQNQSALPSGGIIINAAESLTSTGLDSGDRSRISVESLQGNSGDLVISTKQLSFVGGSTIESDALFAQGGNVTVQATNSVLLSPSPTDLRFTSQISSDANSTGNAGNVTVNTGNLSVFGGSRLASVSFGDGDSGDVTIDAQSILLEGINRSNFIASLISAGTLSDGDAGDVYINTGSLEVKNGGRVDSSTSAFGDAGSVTVNASQSVSVSGTVPGSINPSLIISSANILDELLRRNFNLPDLPTGNAGNLTINTPVLAVTEGAEVSVRNDGIGRGGNLQINADSIRLDERGGVTASTRIGGGGNIRLQAQSAILARNGSRISAEAGGTGDGGNIQIDTPFLLALENSDIIANAFEGNGGNIQIEAQSVLGTAFRDQLTPESDITASSQFGVNGVVAFTNPAVDPSSGTTTLPRDVSDPSNQIVAGCADSQSSQFVASGRGGLPVAPTSQSYHSNRLWTDLRESTHASIDSVVSERPLADTATAPLFEANSWTTNEQGDILLFAQAETATASTVAASNCLAEQMT